MLLNKIEDRWYEIPKWKKILAIFSCVFFLLSLSQINVYSTTDDTGITDGSSFDWAHPFQSLANWACDNILDEIANAIVQAVTYVYAQIEEMANIFIEPFGPDFGTFDSYAGENIRTAIVEWGGAVGMFLATIIFFFCLYAYFFRGKVTDTRDTPISLFGKYIVAAFICLNIKEINDEFIDMMDACYDATTKWSIANATKFKNIIEVGERRGAAEVKFLGLQGLSAFIPGAMVIYMIIACILLWTLIKGFLKMYCELVSRYIISIIFLSLFGAFAGTIVSNNTSSVFGSYIKTLFCSFLLLLFDMFWIKACLYAAIGSDTMSLINYIFVLELLKVGLKMDSMLKSMGLGIATGGGRIASSAGGSLRNLSRMIGQGERAKQHAGEALKGLAQNPNSAMSPDDRKAAFNLGDKLAGGKDSASSQNGNNAAFGMAAEEGKNGRKIDDKLVTNGEAKDIVGRGVTADANDKNAKNALNGLSDAKTKEGLQGILGDGIAVDNAKQVSYIGSDGERHKGVAFSGEDKSGNKVSGVLGSEKGFENGAFIGNGMSVSMKNEMEKGDSRDFSNLDGARNIAGDGVGKALANVGGNTGKDLLQNGGRLEYMGKSENGHDAFKVYDSSGNLKGSIVGDKFTKSVNDMPEADKDKMFNALEKNLNKSGYGVVPNKNGEKFVQNANDPSKWSATVQKIDPATKQLTGDKANVAYTSLGDNPVSKFNASNSMNGKVAYNKPDSSGKNDGYDCRFHTSWNGNNNAQQGGAGAENARGTATPNVNGGADKNTPFNRGSGADRKPSTNPMGTNNRTSNFDTGKNGSKGGSKVERTPAPNIGGGSTTTSKNGSSKNNSSKTTSPITNDRNSSSSGNVSGGYSKFTEDMSNDLRGVSNNNENKNEAFENDHSSYSGENNTQGFVDFERESSDSNFESMSNAPDINDNNDWSDISPENEWDRELDTESDTSDRGFDNGLDLDDFDDFDDEIDEDSLNSLDDDDLLDDYEESKTDEINRLNRENEEREERNSRRNDGILGDEYDDYDD